MLVCAPGACVRGFGRAVRNARPVGGADRLCRLSACLCRLARVCRPSWGLCALQRGVRLFAPGRKPMCRQRSVPVRPGLLSRGFDCRVLNGPVGRGRFITVRAAGMSIRAEVGRTGRYSYLKCVRMSFELLPAPSGGCFRQNRFQCCCLEPLCGGRCRTWLAHGRLRGYFTTGALLRVMLAGPAPGLLWKTAARRPSAPEPRRTVPRAGGRVLRRPAPAF